MSDAHAAGTQQQAAAAANPPRRAAQSENKGHDHFWISASLILFIAVCILAFLHFGPLATQRKESFSFTSGKAPSSSIALVDHATKDVGLVKTKTEADQAALAKAPDLALTQEQGFSTEAPVLIPAPPADIADGSSTSIEGGTLNGGSTQSYVGNEKGEFVPVP